MVIRGRTPSLVLLIAEQRFPRVSKNIQNYYMYNVMVKLKNNNLKFNNIKKLCKNKQ